MVDVEELMSKIKSGVWSTQDAFDCIKDLEQEYLQSSKTKEWREDYSLAAYFTSYGIFACSYRECVFPMIELCQKLLEDCPNSADQALYYLALMRLYFGVVPSGAVIGSRRSRNDDSRFGTAASRCIPPFRFIYI